MTVAELIEQLEDKISDRYKDLDIEIYLDGPISGYIGIRDVYFDAEDGCPIIAVRSERLREAKDR